MGRRLGDGWPGDAQPLKNRNKYRQYLDKMLYVWYTLAKVWSPSELTTPGKGGLTVIRTLNLKPVDMERESVQSCGSIDNTPCVFFK